MNVRMVRIALFTVLCATAVHSQMLGTGTRYAPGGAGILAGINASGSERGAVAVADFGLARHDAFVLGMKSVSGDSWYGAGFGVGIQVLQSRYVDLAVWPTLKMFDAGFSSAGFTPIPIASRTMFASDPLDLVLFAGVATTTNLKTLDSTFDNVNIGFVVKGPWRRHMPFDIRAERNIKTKTWSVGGNYNLR